MIEFVYEDLDVEEDRKAGITCLPLAVASCKATGSLRVLL